MKNTFLRLWPVAPLLALCVIGDAQEAEGTPVGLQAGQRRPPLGLRRLAGGTAETGGSVIPAEAITIVDLVSPQVAGSMGRVESQGKIRYLALPPDAEWSTPLRPLRAGANYTTFTIQASLGSVVSVDGALVSLVKSGHEGYATVVVGWHRDDAVEWRSLDHDVLVRPYSGRLLASLSLVTICTDTESRQWSIILTDQLSAHGLPLGPLEPGAPRMLSVKAGAAGARVCGLANSEENPVFDDANHNGVRDSFETKLLGAPLARHAPRKDWDSLVNLWEQRFDLRPEDFAPAKPDAPEGPQWQNAPSHYFLEIPYADPAPEPAVRGVRGIPGATLTNPNGTRP